MPATTAQREALAKARAARGRQVTPAELFIAQNAGKQSTSETQYMDSDTQALARDEALSPVKVAATEAGKVTMWFLERDGSVPRVVNANSIKQLLEECDRVSVACHDCGGTDHGGAPNDCPAREPRKFRRCPICSKEIYDSMPTGQFLNAPDASDDNEIRDDTFVTSTPLTRTAQSLRVHMMNFHKQEAPAFFRDAPVPVEAA